MRYLIDGYNLMHALGLVRKNGGDQSWLASRRKLLDWLADQLTRRTADQFQVVFDAQRSTGTLESNLHRGVKILIARGRSADDVIEEMLAVEIQPKTTTIVSNDHRLRDAAWHHDCAWITCGAFVDLALGSSFTKKPKPNPEGKPQSGSDLAGDVDLLKIFTQPKK